MMENPFWWSEAQKCFIFFSKQALLVFTAAENNPHGSFMIKAALRIKASILPFLLCYLSCYLQKRVKWWHVGMCGYVWQKNLISAKNGETQTFCLLIFSAAFSNKILFFLEILFAPAEPTKAESFNFCEIFILQKKYFEKIFKFMLCVANYVILVEIWSRTLQLSCVPW